MKNSLIMAFLGLGLLGASSCHKECLPTNTFSFDFSKHQHAWEAGFSDYGEEYVDLELLAEMAPLPEPLNPSGKLLGYKVQGNNRPDDLFMFLKHQVDGLEPNQTYEVEMEITVASDAPKGMIGIGGAPGEAVFMKAGAVAQEPIVTKNAQGRFLVNLDKGNQGEGGKDMVVIGNMAKVDDKPGYASLIRRVENLKVKTDAQGACWLVVGTDSGYEGLTRLYYQKIEARFFEQR